MQEEKKLFVYDSISQNCQFFVKHFLKGAGVWSDSLNKFVMQDAWKVIEGMSFFKKLGKKLTDTANIVDVAKQGQGRKRIVHYIVEI